MNSRVLNLTNESKNECSSGSVLFFRVFFCLVRRCLVPFPLSVCALGDGAARWFRGGGEVLWGRFPCFEVSASPQREEGVPQAARRRITPSSTRGRRDEGFLQGAAEQIPGEEIWRRELCGDLCGRGGGCVVRRNWRGPARGVVRINPAGAGPRRSIPGPTGEPRGGRGAARFSKGRNAARFSEGVPVA